MGSDILQMLIDHKETVGAGVVGILTLLGLFLRRKG